MTTRLSPAQLERLRAAVAACAEIPAGATEQGSQALRTIDMLEREHGARLTRRPDGNALSCAGVRSTCTWSDGYGLLLAWSTLARRRLAQAEAAAIKPTDAEVPY